ncbi:MAG: hypothetical protein M1820_003936 [Bogoriella megaspora]|nr:MAG: hypothetical protein M1820_003936 [Bogoriella megaspora]
MKHCNETHKSCQQHQLKRTFIPSRLLDINSSDAERVRIIETKNDESIKGPYMTVSHCWGDSKIFEPTKLTEEKKTEFITEGVVFETLPKSFQEAIEVCRYLGVAYIWIDSLCIVQGDSEDWEQEAPLMHQIYRNSYCNIAATDSTDGRGGLFRGRTASDIVPTKYRAGNKSPFLCDRTWLVVAKDIWKDELLFSPVYSRGWVFQERMLSPRLLHFAKHQVFWDCAAVSACETFPSGLPPQLDKDAGTDRYWRASLQTPSSLRQQTLFGPADYSLEYFWKNALLCYTSCDLSKGKDKLIALWGVAKLLRDALGEQYGAGLWEGNLEEQLAWKVSECRLDERPQELSHNPTWSWASMGGAIQTHDRFLNTERCYHVTDHAGRPIRFELKDQGVELREPTQNCTEEFQRMDQKIAQMKGSKEHTTSSIERANQRWNDILKTWDDQPELLCRSIQIQGHLVKMRLHENVSESKWVPEFLHNPSHDPNMGKFEVFPDVKPKTDQALFLLVLAATEYQADETDFYKGYGIVLQRTDDERHYYRTGALHFENISETTWKWLQNTDLINFWLD